MKVHSNGVVDSTDNQDLGQREGVVLCQGGGHDRNLQVVAIQVQAGGALPRPPAPVDSNSRGPSLNARCGVYLTPWDKAYLPQLVQWRNNPELLHLWNGDRRLVPVDRIEKELDELLEKATALLAFRRADPKPIGFVYAAPATSPVQKHLTVGAFIDAAGQGRWYGPAAVGLLIRYLFDSFDVPKLEFLVYGWNTPSLEVTRHLGEFRLEGIRTGHVFWRGEVHDLYEFGLDREGYRTLSTGRVWRRLIG